MFVLLLSVCVSAHLDVLYCIEFVVFIYTERERERESERKVRRRRFVSLVALCMRGLSCPAPCLDIMLA